MQEFIIQENEAGQRLDKYLKKKLNQAPTSFLYKMLRKKNIVWNGKKADGSEKLKAGDSVKKGDVLVVLEAMKMENEIMAPHDAKVAQVLAAKGATVNTGDVLVVLE